jgi:hypothetical protein
MKRHVFRIASLEAEEKVCRKGKLGKEEKSWLGWMKRYKLRSCGE